MLFKCFDYSEHIHAQTSSVQASPDIYHTVTSSLGAKFKEYFSKILDSLATAEGTREELDFVKRNLQENDEGFMDIDEEQSRRADLPS